MEMINENGDHNDLPSDDPAFKWAWEIYKEADHLVHSRTTFFFVAQSFLVVAYSTFAVNRVNWKENQGIYIIAMCIIVFTGIIFSLNPVGVELHRHQKNEGKIERSIFGEEQDVEGICRAKMGACQNSFRNCYSGLPAFGLDRLRDNDVIDIEITLIVRRSFARVGSPACRRACRLWGQDRRSKPYRFWTHLRHQRTIFAVMHSGVRMRRRGNVLPLSLRTGFHEATRVYAPHRNLGIGLHNILGASGFPGRAPGAGG